MQTYGYEECIQLGHTLCVSVRVCVPVGSQPLLLNTPPDKMIWPLFLAIRQINTQSGWFLDTRFRGVPVMDNNLPSVCSQKNIAGSDYISR